MNWLEAIVLGIVQGLTEFLPVSSSGHLELAKSIFGDINNDGMLMTVVLHFATALSTLVIFRKEVLEIIKGVFLFSWNQETFFSIKIILSMIPAVFVGLYFDETIELLFNGNLVFVGLMLLFTGILLFLADRAKSTNREVSFKHAIIIGIAQAIAILPGISRSGATIATSVLLGIDRAKAAKFSFLMVVPLIFGKMIKDILSGDVLDSTVPFAELTVGFFAAFFTGLLACKLMISLVKKSKLIYFSIYCFLVGLSAILFLN